MALDYDDFDLRMAKGDNKTLSLTIRNKSDGSYVDLTGWTIWVTAKKKASDADPGVFQLVSDGNGITWGDQTDPALRGRATATIAPDDTGSLSYAGEAALWVDVQVRDADDQIYTETTGRLRVRPDMTRSIS